MKVTAVHTPLVTADGPDLEELLATATAVLHEGSVVAVTSKIVALCEGRTVPIAATDRDELIKSESEYYIETPDNAYSHHFTITHQTLIPAAGIDESNADGRYVLWPADPCASARRIRQYLCRMFGVSRLGVIVTDSTISLSRWGTLGIAIGHAGFDPVKSYIGLPDLFGRIMCVSQSNIAGGLAAAAVLAMGEGAEQTPIAIIEDVPFVTFTTNQSATQTYYISPRDDAPFAPFFGGVIWHKGGRLEP